jgi:hypothetical protein
MREFGFALAVGVAITMPATTIAAPKASATHFIENLLMADNGKPVPGMP